MNNSSCYPTTQRCVYQTYKSSSLFCSGLEHLYHCDEFECPGMFKCPGTYCIPTRMLCDQSPDCPNKEDEQDCHDKLVCPGLLRCREENICVHPDEICDGILHCLMTGDDEMFCEVTDCPESCVCRGSSAKCDGISDITYRHTKSTNLKILIINNFKMQRNAQYREIRLIHLRIEKCIFVKNMITSLLFLKLHQLRFLYLIRSQIEYVQSHSFSKLTLLEVLEIKEHQIQVLVDLVFTGLQLLPLLDLSQLSINSVHSEALFGLTNVQYLNLSLNPITELHDYLFLPLHHLQSVDLRHTKLIFLEEHSLFLPSLSVFMYFDKPLYCCYLSEDHRCSVNNVLVKEQQQCRQIMSTKFSEYVVVGLSATAVIVLNVTSMILLRKRRMYRSHLVLCQHLNATNMLPAISMILLSIASSLYSNNYIYIKSIWPKSLLCNILYSLPEIGYTSCRCCVFLIVLDQLLAMKYPLKQQRLSAIQLLGVLYSYMLFILIWHISRAFYIDISNVNCHPLIVTPLDTLLEWLGRMDVIASSIFVVTTTSFMYYTIVQTVQRSSRRIRSSRSTDNTVTSIIKHAIVMISIELINLLSLATLMLVTFYYYNRKPEHISVLISIMTLLMNSLHVVYFAFKQHI